MIAPALLFASSLAFTPTLPIAVPNTDSWQVRVDDTFDRTIAQDLLLVRSQAVRFIQTRNVCPVEPQSDCTYRVHYRHLQKNEGGRLIAYVQRYRIIGPTGVTIEGLSYMKWQDNRPFIQMFFWTGTVWVREYRIRELYEPAWDYFAMLVEKYQRREFSPF